MIKLFYYRYYSIALIILLNSGLLSLAIADNLPLTPTTPPAISPIVPTSSTTPQPIDYQANLTSEVFGTQLFTGRFAQPAITQFNPNYLITIGDQIQVRLWGGYSFDAVLTVDAQGYIFLPQVGPIHVLGVNNQALQTVIESAIRPIFRANVSCYANLIAAHPVRVFVGGFVKRPGLYNGTSLDSLLHYLDMAGGIDPDRGSFLDIQIKRDSQIRTQINLYDFLLSGHLPLIQLTDGDTIFVTNRHYTVKVNGAVSNAKRFEFQSPFLLVSQLAQWAKPNPKVTHLRITRNRGTIKNIEYYLWNASQSIRLQNGDEVEFTIDKKPGTITVRVEGEHQSAQEYVLPYGATMADLLPKIQLSERSDIESLQLFRQSVHDRQKAKLLLALKQLETAILTARSNNAEEVQLRKEEAALILQWIDRAKNIEPTGQVMLAQARNRNRLLLENGDKFKIPPKDGLILINGEVLFPNTIAFDPELEVEDYIHLTGGYTQNADSSRVLILHRDGSFENADDEPELRAGDNIMVMPQISTKYWLIGKELMQIMFQIAVSASVLLML